MALALPHNNVSLMRDIHLQSSVESIYRNQIRLELVAQRQKMVYVCVCVICLVFGWVQSSQCVRTVEGFLLTGNLLLCLYELTCPVKVCFEGQKLFS